jgi:hypothetical protein
MRRFRLKDSAVGYEAFTKGRIYNEDFVLKGYSLPVRHYVKVHPKDWEEVFDPITLTTESEKSKFVISYISRGGLIVLNNIIEADNFQEAIDIIKGDEGVSAILSCYKS